jgi:hypothetical protein
MRLQRSERPMLRTRRAVRRRLQLLKNSSLVYAVQYRSWSEGTNLVLLQNDITATTAKLDEVFDACDLAAVETCGGDLREVVPQLWNQLYQAILKIMLD